MLIDICIGKFGGIGGLQLHMTFFHVLVYKKFYLGFTVLVVFPWLSI